MFELSSVGEVLATAILLIRPIGDKKNRHETDVKRIQLKQPVVSMSVLLFSHATWQGKAENQSPDVVSPWARTVNVNEGQNQFKTHTQNSLAN